MEIKTSTGIKFSFPFLLILFTFLWGIGAPMCRAAEDDVSWNLSARPWPEASDLFRKNPQWLGGDGASSVDIGNGRILWLFGDSFIDTEAPYSRRGASIVRNSLAVQSGRNPAAAAIDFVWKTSEGKPASYFAEKGTRWFWPGGGIRLEDRLLIFLMEIVPSPNIFGFDPAGWQAVMILNPDKKPEDWQLQWLETPVTYPRMIVGTGSVLAEGAFVYAFAVDSLTHQVSIIRWDLPSVLQGNLSSPQWWMKGSWIEGVSADCPPTALFRTNAMEFSVHYDRTIQKFLQIESGSFERPDLIFRTAPTITGPWSDRRSFYTPPKAGDPDLLIYAGKAHPVLEGARPAVTYVVNAKELGRLLTDRSIYYPAMLKGTIARGNCLLIKKLPAEPHPHGARYQLGGILLDEMP